ncbi:hybrid sensor histidine kinase/response regulator [Maritimibacter dapengensis]|uniref:histidine kinase n=1 Tax=Maritimibacter dapengensis TaxID=2836868 RepID=A0ABS6T4D7_9RHOB|nr:PAS domain-containing hybrid sensor histidine kinase/response regulator [Maritimibacter dapengensis]MBV7379845.1 response regulator [Maritimibacter dapengensis]
MENLRQSYVFRNLAIAFAAVLGIAVAVYLGGEVLRKLNLLETAASDNVQWTLSQVEVEFLDLDLATKSYMIGDIDDLDVIRREFDIFYSRIGTLSEGDLYLGLRNETTFADALATIRGFLEAAVPIIDSTDSEMEADLPELSRDIDAIRLPVRELSATGLTYFAEQADMRRGETADTLAFLAAVTLAVLSALALVSIVLFRVNRINVQRAATIEMSSRRMATIVQSSLDAIVAVDRAGRIIEFSAAAEEIFGHRKSDVVGRDMGEIIVPDALRGAHEAGMSRYRETGEKRVAGKGRINVEAIRADGTVFPVEISIQSADSSDGEIFVGFLRDISRRVAAERELVEARDKAVAGEKAKSEFLAVMSHEMRTPLNGLLGTLSLLKDTRLTSKQADYVDNLQVSGDLLLSHINDVLDVTKYEAGALTIKPVPTDLSALVQNVVDSQRDLGSEAGNTIQWRWVGEPLHHVMTEPMRLSQVLINLVGNAVKFTQNGTITIELLAENTDTGADLTILVQDTGIGIAPEDIERMFQDFATADTSYGRARSGTGLGLGIARRLVTALGGKIGAESELGEGSTFWVRLPVTLAAPVGKTRETAATADNHHAERRNVLIIEDNEINRIVLKDMLLAEGHRVTEAVDGLEGVDHAQQQPFDLILTDISMPVLDGIAATQVIREKHGPNHTTPIYAVTAHAMPDEINRFLQAGMSGVLAKPINRAELRKILASRQLEPTQQSTQTVIVNEKSVEGLRRDIGIETVSNLYRKFRTDASTILNDMSEHPPQTDPRPKIGHLSHKLAGSASIFGAEEFVQSLRDIEQDATSNEDTTLILKKVEAAKGVWKSTEAVLDRAFKE